jgi:hypothetical protein
VGAENITRSVTLENVHEDDEGTGIYWFTDSSGQYEQAAKKTPRGCKRDRARVVGGQDHQVNRRRLGGPPLPKKAIKKVGNVRKRVEKRLSR